MDPRLVIAPLSAIATLSVISTEGRNPMTREHRYFVYLLTNWNNKVMYVGMTNDLLRRVYEHKTKAVKDFTEKYNVSRLVYFEETSDVLAALAREKEIKKWRREKKNALVIQANPEWRDLSKDFGLPPSHSASHSPWHATSQTTCHSSSAPSCHSERREES